MNEVDKMILSSKESIEASKKTLQDLANEVSNLADIIQPALEKQIMAIRSARMATVNEIRESLLALREIRKFFLEDDYQKEMDRLAAFVALCKEVQTLKTDGTFDAVAETMIHLAVKSTK